MVPNRFRILALDVDGTLLDPDGVLRPRTIAAVRRVAETGTRVVLCTGRRYRRALPIAVQLGLDTPLVCNSGALIKEPNDHQTLWRADIPRAILEPIFELFRNRQESAVSFTDRSPNEFDFLIAEAATGRPLFDDYVDQNHPHAEVDATWMDRADLPHFHLCAINEPAAMLEFEREVLDRFAGRVQTFVQKSPRYAGTMCEILRHDANKWTALERLANQWGVRPEAICAVGDDRNDLPMIIGAGFGVAMGQAGQEIRDAADFVTASDAEDGLAQVIKEIWGH